MSEKIKMSFMRSEIARIYGPSFIAGMPPRQVAAIYRNMKSRGKFGPKQDDGYYQMNLADWALQLKGDVEFWEIR